MLIYKITNTKNSKIYIGKWQGTSAQERWRQHVREAVKGSKRYLCAAIRKWGADAFQVEEIGIAHTPRELAQLEIDLISHYQSHLREKGYNQTLGGERDFGVMLGRHHTAATRLKIRASKLGKPNGHEGKKCSDEWRENVRKGHLGQHPSQESLIKMVETRKRLGIRSGMLGKSHSETTKQRMVEAQRVRREQSSICEPRRELIEDLVSKKVRVAKIYRALVSNGFPGEASSVYRFIKKEKAASAAA